MPEWRGGAGGEKPGGPPPPPNALRGAPPTPLPPDRYNHLAPRGGRARTSHPGPPPILAHRFRPQPRPAIEIACVRRGHPGPELQLDVVRGELEGFHPLRLGALDVADLVEVIGLGVRVVSASDADEASQLHERLR